MEYSRALFDAIVVENTLENTRWRLFSSSQFWDDIKNISMDQSGMGNVIMWRSETGRKGSASPWFTPHRTSTCHLDGTLCCFHLFLQRGGEINLAKEEKWDKNTHTHLPGWCNALKFQEHSRTIKHFCRTTYRALSVCACSQLCILRAVHARVAVCTCHSFTHEIDASSVIRSCSVAWRQFSSPALLLHASVIARPYYNTDFFCAVFNSEVV